MDNLPFKIGDALVEKVHELDLNKFTLAQLFPSLDPKVVEKHPSWFDESTYVPKSGRVALSIHSWLVRHDGKIILIDTAAGNRKSRPTLKVLDHLHDPFLKRLAKQGVNREMWISSYTLTYTRIMWDGTPRGTGRNGRPHFQTQQQSVQIENGDITPP